MTNNSTKRPFAFEVPATTTTLSTFTTPKIDLEEDEGAIRESVCSPGSPTKRCRPSRLQVDEMGSGGVDPFPSLGTPLLTATAIASAGRTLTHTLASTLEKELVEEEARNKGMRRSFLAPLEVDDDAAGVDPFLPSFTKTGHPVLGVCDTKPWEQDGCENEEEGKADEGALDEEGGVQDRSQLLGFDDEDEHVQLQQLASQLAALGK